MDIVLSGLQGIELFVYMDDIVIYAESLKEHNRKLHELLSRLQSTGLTLQPEKCHFLHQEISYLGHVISTNGVKPDPAKILAVKEFPVPRTAKNVRQFLGLVGYYRRFIKEMAHIARPLTKLLKKNAIFSWNKETQKSFEILRDIICTEPLLQFPNFESTFIITTDASEIALGAVLSQGKIGSDLPVAYASRGISKAEVNYTTTEKELLAAVFGITYFKPYVYGREFVLVTDHRPLAWLHNHKDMTSRVARWRVLLMEYEFTIVHKPGKLNSNADALSRNPIPDLITETPIDEQVNNVEMIDIDTGRVQKLVVGADNTVVETSSRDCNFREIENEVGTVFTCLNEITDTRDFDEMMENDNLKSRAGPLSSDVLNGSQGSALEVPKDNEMMVGGMISREAGISRYCAGSVLWSCHGFRYVDHHGLTLCRERSDPPCLIPRGPLCGPVVLPRLLRSVSVSKSNRLKSVMEMAQDVESVNELHEVEYEKGNGDGDDVDVDCVSGSARALAIDTHNVESDDGNNDSSSNLSPVIYITSKDHIWNQNDNFVHFFSLDKEVVSPISQFLSTKGMIPYNELGKYECRLGDTLAIPLREKYIFHLMIKDRHDHEVQIETLKSALSTLKDMMRMLNITTFSVSRDNNDLDPIDFETLRNLITIIFADRSYIVTICTDEIIKPPVSQRRGIIKQYHESPVGGHQGVTKLYSRIRADFCWTDMRRDIADVIRTCPSCQRNKILTRKIKQPMRLTDTPSVAFEVIQMDIVGPLPLSKHGNKYLLTIQDNLTKFADIIPLAKIDATNIACAFSEQFISRFGCPRVIHTDQGSNFMSQIMRNLCKIFRIQRINSTAFHPQSLGSLERAHRVFVDYLRHYCTNSDWDEWIRFAIFSYNTSVHEGTQFTPHELVYGVKASIPSEFSNNRPPVTYVQHLTDLLGKLAYTQSKAKENLEQAKSRSKRHYDRTINPHTFKVGDMVYLLKEPRYGKFDVKWTGPYEVMEVYGDRNVKLIIRPEQHKIVHADKLKLAHIRLDDDL